MNTTEVKIGAFTFWAGSEWYDRVKLAEKLNDIGQGHRLPEFTTPEKLVKLAMDHVLGGPGVIIRKMDQGWSAHTEIKGTTRNEYPHLMSVKVVNKNDVVTLEFNPWDERSEEVIKVYNSRRNWVTNEATVRLLTHTLAEWNCRPLKPSGGIYWVMPQRIEAWEEIARAVEASSITGLTEVYVTRHAVDTDTIRSLRSQVKREVAEWTHKTKDEIINGLDGKPMGKRGLDHRSNEAVRMRQDLKEYEDLLGETLVELHDMIEDVSRAGAMAIMGAMVKADE